MRQAQEREFHSFDQVPLFYRYWAGTTATPATRAIVLLHRGHEHSGRVTHLVDELDLPNTAFFAQYPVMARDYPYLLVLDADGGLLVSQATGELRRGEAFQPARVSAFLKQWAPDKPE